MCRLGHRLEERLQLFWDEPSVQKASQELKVELSKDRVEKLKDRARANGITIGKKKKEELIDAIVLEEVGLADDVAMARYRKPLSEEGNQAQ